MAAVVDEAAVLELLDRWAGTDVGEQTRERRAAPAGVDDEVGTHLVAVLGDHTHDVRDTVDLSVAGEQTLHRDTAAQLDARRAGRDPPDRGLDHRTASGEHGEARVVGAQAAAHLHRHPLERVHPERPVGVELDRDRRQLRLDDLAEAREEVVQHPELIHAPALPRIPRLRGAGCRRRRVTFEHPDPVPVGREQHRRGLARETTPDDHDLDHVPPLPSHAESER